MPEIAKTVYGVYVFDEGSVTDSTTFSTEEAADAVTQTQQLEADHRDADRTVLSTERTAELADVSPADVHERQVAVAQEVTKQKLTESGKRDQILIQAVRALDDLNEMNNEASERLRPWFALHFPELEEQIASNEELAELLSESAHRDDLDEFRELANDSTGMNITEEDARMIQRFAANLDDAYTLREELEDYIEDIAPDIVPNLDALLGSLLAARLVSLAGSLDSLAKKPASTIQVLGAEKAMFRHMRGEGEAPKHGVLFQHETVQNVPGNRTGDMARVLANKAAIAARLDRYDGDFKGDELREDVEERFEEIRD